MSTILGAIVGAIVGSLLTWYLQRRWTHDPAAAEVVELRKQVATLGDQLVAIRKAFAEFKQSVETKEDERAEFEHFPLDISLQQGSPGNYIVNVRNDSEREVAIETIQILRGDAVGDCPLTEASKPKAKDDWKIGPSSGKQLYWAPQDDPVVMLRTLDPNRFPPMRGTVIPIIWVVTFRVAGKLLSKRRTQKVNISGTLMQTWGSS